jgi:hemerythrin-like domain-containing protein
VSEVAKNSLKPSDVEVAIFAKLHEAHAEVLDLCEVLENIADSLPNNIDIRKCLIAAQIMQPLIERVHRYEEATVFPMIAGASPGEAMQNTIQRLHSEHLEDECHAEDLSDALKRLASADEPISPETLGYMLRGFFEAIRRHIAFEREQLLPMAH